MPPKSSGSPQRLIGTREMTLLLKASLPWAPAVMSVAIQPGRMALARTP
jgi:hypothetical protein